MVHAPSFEEIIFGIELKRGAVPPQSVVETAEPSWSVMCIFIIIYIKYVGLFRQFYQLGTYHVWLLLLLLILRKEEKEEKVQKGDQKVAFFGGQGIKVLTGTRVKVKELLM